MTSSYWLCAFLFESHKAMREVQKCLSENNIDSRPFFTPLEKFPMYNNQRTAKTSNFLVSHGLCFPSHVNLTEFDIDFIIDTVRGSLE